MNVLESLAADPALVLIGTKALNRSEILATTYHVSNTDFYFFVTHDSDCKDVLIRIFKKRDSDDEVLETLDILLVCKQLNPEEFLDTFSGAQADSVIYNLNLFVGVL